MIFIINLVKINAMSRKYFVILGLSLAVGFLFLNTSAVKAETWTWTGGGDKQTWTDAANWGLSGSSPSAASYPGATTTADVVITANTPGLTVYATTSPAYGINSLTLGAADIGWTLYIGGVNFGASSTVSVIGTSTLKLATSTYGAGTLNLGQTTGGAPLNLVSTAIFTAATGTVAYIGGGTAAIYVATTTFYNLTLAATTTSATVAIRTYKFGSFAATAVSQLATTTVSNIFYVATSSKADFQGKTDLLLSGSGTPFSKTYGDFIQPSKIVYSSTSATNIATGTYANLELTGAATKTLLGGITATSTLTIPASGTLAVGNYRATLNTTADVSSVTITNGGTITVGDSGTLYADSSTFTNSGTLTLGNSAITLSGATFTNSGAVTLGATGLISATSTTWANTGTVTVTSGGKITLAGVGVLSNSAGGTAVTAFGNADSFPVVHIEITDKSLNFLTTAESYSATVTSVSGITDGETVTLTETTATSGVFRGSIGFQLSGSDVSGVLDYTGSGSVSYSWVDSQDSADTETSAATFTGTALGGGGGGGGGGAAATTVTTTTTTTTATTTTTTPTTPVVTTTPTTTAVTTLETVQTKVASVVAKIAALPTNPTASDLASIQAEIAAILTELQSIQAAQPTPQGVALGFNFVRPLALGLRHADVSDLQTALKTDSSIYPEGLVTGYFGSMTLKAVQKFQEKYGIASSGKPGYGTVGPKTRAKLNKLFGNK